MDQSEATELWYQPDLDVYLNRWFSNYDDARESLEREGGFLLPYKSHFFVCEEEVITALGLDPDDPDWKNVAWNCAVPRDEAAFERLRLKRKSALLSKVSSKELGGPLRYC